MTYTLHLGDCANVLRTFPDDHFDAIVTDPPAGIGFADFKWDSDRGSRDQWIEWMRVRASECLRVLKPGAHAFVWALPRTSHWTATAFENAGFEVRDRLIHLFFQGMPRAYDISKALDRLAGASREIVARRKLPVSGSYVIAEGRDMSLVEKRRRAAHEEGIPITIPATDLAKRFEDWKTSLRPCVEDWWLFRKPISERTIAENVRRWRTGGLNIGACRVGKYRRYPAHLTHDGSDFVTSLFPDTVYAGTKYGYGDSGSAARFFEACPPDTDDLDTILLFYCKKVTKSDRGAGNTHPTVKPTPLMRYLIRMITPPDGIILDPFAGSGSTLKAAILEGFNCVGIECDGDYVAIAERRCQVAQEQVTKPADDVSDLPLFASADADAETET